MRKVKTESELAAAIRSAREVGVIGVAVFPERYNPPPRPVYVPRYDRRRGDDYYGPLGNESADKAKDEAPKAEPKAAKAAKVVEAGK